MCLLELWYSHDDSVYLVTDSVRLATPTRGGKSSHYPSGASTLQAIFLFLEVRSGPAAAWERLVPGWLARSLVLPFPFLSTGLLGGAL